MTFHATRIAKAKGSRRTNDLGHACNPRIVATLPEDDMACLCWWAGKKGVPVAEILRNAVWAYLQCVRADFERESATVSDSRDGCGVNATEERERASSESPAPKQVELL